MDDHVIPAKKEERDNTKKILLTNSQKVSVGVLATLAVIMPVFIFFTLSPLKPIITPASGPITPTVTSNPTPTSEVTPTGEVTPTPPPNNNPPVITTLRLNNARVNRSYKTSILGYDQDLGDQLEFSITSDADWLILGNCRSVQRRIFWWKGQKANVISCQLSGVPQAKGTVDVTLTLSDGNEETSKTLTLKVR